MGLSRGLRVLLCIGRRLQQRAKRLAGAAAFAGIAGFAGLPADAAQPLVTDDAAVVAPKTCQLEAWMQAFSDARAYWMLPACNPAEDLELSAGGARVHSEEEGWSTVLQLQAKLVPFPRGDGPASFGGLIGALHQTAGTPLGVASWGYYGKALASLYPSSRLEIDLNLGAAYLSGPGTYAIGGVAVQYMLIDRVQLLGELFRDQPGRSKYQAGLRFYAIPDRLEAYVSVGNRIGGASTDWWTIIGIRLQTRPFLP